tara:strand:- start:554 stop:1003 length:450 start_codon:yes stop_codon:yes gene_type:complete
MEPTTMMYIASGLMSASRYNRAGKIAKQEAALTARRIKVQAKQKQLQKLQEHNDIVANLQTFKGSNMALAGISGRDTGSDRTFKRIQEKAKEDTSVAAQRLNLQGMMDQSNLAQKQQMVLLQGQNKAKSYRMMGFQSILNTAYGTSKLV